MRVDHNEYDTTLAKFLAYIDGTEIINDYIKDCGNPTYDIKSEVEEVANSYGRIYFDLGDTTQEEIANIYHTLKYLNENNFKVVRAVAQSYTSSNKWQDMAKGFNERVVMVLIRHIEGYLTKIGIEMGMDENVRYSISVNNGQVNLASDNATVNAVQYNSVDSKGLSRLIESIKKEMSCISSDDDIEAVDESIEVIQSELLQPKPKKSLLKAAISTLQAIKGTAEFTAAVAALIQFVQSGIL